MARAASRCACRVYPRGCGGTPLGNVPHASASGLSPRVRGNHCCEARGSPVGGSIPAGAGEPGGQHGREGWGRVYPRGCGGTSIHSGMRGTATGLSPRVRGNREAARNSRRALAVYPRGCGGTDSSTRAREAINEGSIPAGAGEPAIGDIVDGNLKGLSPRVRGNPQGLLVVQVPERSIPAGAGEPCPEIPEIKVTTGLSPRVRGNLQEKLETAGNVRAIPAGAGEPTY